MKSINKKIIKVFLIFIFLLGSFTSCKKDYFDVNTSPNLAADADVSLLLPSAEAAIAHTLGNDLQIDGGLWAQYWTQGTGSSQYKQFENYSPTSNDFDYPWKILYSDALQDLKVIVSKATLSGQTQYVACAKILQAYAFQLLTDNFGDIPFSESVKFDEGIIAPHYDKQIDVYNGIIKLLTDGIALIDESVDATVPHTPGTADLLLGGNMLQWKEFGNTLLLKVYLRLSEVDPGKAQTGIAALNASAAAFLQSGEQVQIIYTTEGGKTNPLYSAEVALNKTQNLVASSTSIDYLINTNDPRIDNYYSPAANGLQLGIPQGAYDLPAGTPYSIPSPLTGANAGDPTSATAPVKLMSSYESMFLQAEAAARGWLSTADAQTSYEAAITESFTLNNFGDSAVGFIAQSSIAYPAGGTLQDKIKAIITQKWAAMCGNQNDEAWIESRRTNYPDFFTISVNSSIGTTNFPARFVYPNTEVTRNSNFPGQTFITDKMWWDVN